MVIEDFEAGLAKLALYRRAHVHGNNHRVAADAVELAKSEMVTDLPGTAVAILNADDPRVVRMAPRTIADVVWFGLDSSADVRADDVEATATGTATAATGLKQGCVKQIRRC